MVFTTDSVSGCTTAQMNHGYAIWDGSKWVVQYETSGCPKLFINPPGHEAITVVKITRNMINPMVLNILK